jgi:hypothetical protein
VKAPTAATIIRLRIEHAQVTTPAQIAQFKELKVIASMQPSHVLTDMRWAQDRLGPSGRRLPTPGLAFLNKGVTLAFGTDYPVEPVTPFRGLYAAVTRKSEDGKQEYFPEQRLTMDQAICGLYDGLGLRRVRGERERQAGAGYAGGLCRPRPRPDRGFAGEVAGDQGAAHRGWGEDGLRSKVRAGLRSSRGTYLGAKARNQWSLDRSA